MSLLNIMSIQNGQVVSGATINEWCHAQIDNATSHEKEAERLLKKQYNDDVFYIATRDEKKRRCFQKVVMPGELR